MRIAALVRVWPGRMTAWPGQRAEDRSVRWTNHACQRSATIPLIVPDAWAKLATMVAIDSHHGKDRQRQSGPTDRCRASTTESIKTAKEGTVRATSTLSWTPRVLRSSCHMKKSMKVAVFAGTEKEGDRPGGSNEPLSNVTVHADLR